MRFRRLARERRADERPPFGSLAALDERAGSAARAVLDEGESVLFCLPGPQAQALVATDRRIVVVKAGALAGSLLGARVGSYRYADVVDVSVAAGEANAVISVSAARDAPEHEWWQARQVVDDPLRALNALVLPLSELERYEPFVERLRALVAAARGEPTGEGLVAELERLAALRDAGSLSDDEFERAKRALLGY